MKKSIVLLLAILTFVLCSCETSDPFQIMVVDGVSYSTVNNYGGYGAITGIELSNKTKETLILPTMVNDIKLNWIGVKRGMKSNGAFKISDFKNVYIGSNYTKVITSIEYDKISLEKLFIGGENIDASIYGYLISSPIYYENAKYNIFVSDSYYKKMVNIYGEDRVMLKSANVVYYLDEHNSFFVDDCDGTLVNVVPPVPYKEGYLFEGWYKDIECTNKWDFDNDVIPMKQYDEYGNYIFIETRIYAKWTQIE